MQEVSGKYLSQLLTYSCKISKTIALIKIKPIGNWLIEPSFPMGLKKHSSSA